MLEVACFDILRKVIQKFIGSESWGIFLLEDMLVEFIVLQRTSVENSEEKHL
jgi:hypothetical protein